MQKISVRNGLHLVFARNSDSNRDIFVGMTECHREAYKIGEDIVERGIFQKYYVVPPYHYECECQMKEYGIDIVISEDLRLVTFEHYHKDRFNMPRVIYRVLDHKFINGRWVPDNN